MNSLVSGPVGVNLEIEGGTVGSLYHRNLDAVPEGSCKTFAPGIVLPASENLSCSHESGSLPGTCTASVVVSKK